MMSSQFLERLKKHYKKALPFVVYSKPNSLVVKALLQNTTDIHYTEYFEETGFVFSPFNSEEQSVIIPANQSEIIETETLEAEDFVFESATARVTKNNLSQKKKSYLELAEKTILKIKEGTYKKVVISREERLTVNEQDAITLFLRLFKAYNNALVYCFYHPQIGLWLGATPETFLSIEGKQFTTMSLAGTKKIETHQEWQAKELSEQQLVTNYITEGISPLTKTIKISDVETVQAGTLHHLKTTICGQLNDEQGNNFNKLLSTLHPTPAVCGLPKAASKQFILEHENYNRAFYTGFLGELNFKQSKTRNANRRNVENNAYSSIKNTSSLYVNLRCMQLKGNEAIIYVGGGITKDSIAEKEWEETVNKSQTMKKVLY